MEVKLFKYLLKEDVDAKMEEWVSFFYKNKVKVTESLQREKVTLESWFIEKSDNRRYLYCYFRCENFKEAMLALGKSNDPVDVFHKNIMKDIIEKNVGEIQLLIDVTV